MLSGIAYMIKNEVGWKKTCCHQLSATCFNYKIVMNILYMVQCPQREFHLHLDTFWSMMYIRTQLK